MANWRRFTIIPLGLLALKGVGQQVERPNILLLSFEDSSAELFSCYGNKFVNTPNVDSLASRGLQYTNVWSVAPQSSPARSSLITGAYATTYAMDLHRNRQKTPENILFPQLLRDAGYYCTNNSKTDYNTSLDHKSCWDDSSKTASYNNKERKNSQPFFAVFNCMASHMGRIRSFHTDGRRDYREEGIDKDELILPPYLPDLPEVRSDYAGHLESIQDIDEWLAIFLKDLEDRNLADNTVIFFFSDHGGCLPRGKGYLYESGLKVPFIVYLPPKWQHLSSAKSGSKLTDLVNFTDIAPTILNIAGLDVPKRLDGNIILGDNKSVRKYNFAFTTNQHHVYMPSRAISDGQFKYIRRYIPYKYVSLRNYYQWGMPSNMAWDKLILQQEAISDVLIQAYQNNGSEQLFDLENDPYELRNLILEEEYSEKLSELRNELSNHIRRTKDLGFFIPSSRSEDVNLYELANNSDYPLNALFDLVEKAHSPKKEDIAFFTQYLTSQKNEFRFWAAVAFSNLVEKKEVRNLPLELSELTNDPDDYVAAEACYALFLLNPNDTKALKRLVSPRNEAYRKSGYSLLEVLAMQASLKQKITQNFVVEALTKSASYINIQDNEDSGLMASGILVNLGLRNISDMYGDDAYDMGIKTNTGRRRKLPIP